MLSAATATLDDWEVSYHTTMASTVKVRRQATATTKLLVAFPLWRISWKTDRLIRLLRVLDSSINKSGPEDITKLSEEMRKLHDALVEFYKIAERRGLTNYMLTSRPIRNIRSADEEMVSFLEVYELSVNVDLSAAVADAKAASERGENISFEKLKASIEM